MIQAPLVDDAATRRRSSAARYESPLPLAGLVALTFFSVTGGPFGQELLVKAGGREGSGQTTYFSVFEKMIFPLLDEEQ